MATEQQMSAIVEAGNRGILNPQQVQAAIELNNRGKLEGKNLNKVKASLSIAIERKRLTDEHNEEIGAIGRGVVGLGRGFKDVGEGMTQLALEAAEASQNVPAWMRTAVAAVPGVGPAASMLLNAGQFVPQGSADQFTQQAQEERNLFEQNLGDSTAASVGRFTGNVLPTLLIPGGVAGGVAQRAATAGLGGAAVGGASFVPEGGSRLEQTAVGGLLGGGASLVGSGLKSGYNALKPVAGNAVDNISQLLGNRTTNLVDEFAGNRITPEAAKRLRSSSRLGEQLTPAEAFDDPILAARQGASGTSEEGARSLVNFGKARTERQGDQISGFLDKLSADESSASSGMRDAARKILRDQQDALSKQAAPLYDKAFQTKIPTNIVRTLADDPVLSAAAQKVKKNPIYKKALAGSGPKDLKFWDLVKRDVDDQIETAVRAGERNRSRLLQDSKKLLTSSLDEASGDYSAARAIYGEGARPLQQLREGVVGRIADLEDSQLKNVSKILFDTTQTDPSVLGQVRKQFVKENPDAWKKVIRNEIERRLDSVKADRTGSSFYNNILAKDRDFRMFLNATRGMPEIQRTLIDMRRVWGNLINPESVKGAAGKAKSSLDVPRSSVEAAANFIKNKLGGQADRAAVELITDPNWSKEVLRISQIASQPRRDNELLKLIIEIAGKSTRGGLVQSMNLEASEVSEQ